MARNAAFSAVGIDPGFQSSTVFLSLSARLAAAPAEAICSPGEGNEGRSWGLAYLSEVAAPVLKSAQISDSRIGRGPN